MYLHMPAVDAYVRIDYEDAVSFSEIASTGHSAAQAPQQMQTSLIT